MPGWVFTKIYFFEINFLRPAAQFIIFAKKAEWGGLAEGEFVARACKARAGPSAPPTGASIGGFLGKKGPGEGSHAYIYT